MRVTYYDGTSQWKMPTLEHCPVEEHNTAVATRGRTPFGETIAVALGIARRHRFRIALIGGFALPFHGVRRATGDVDFLADAAGTDHLHAGLLAAGARCLHRSAEAANYGPAGARLAPVHFIFAQRPRALAMLERARARALAGTRLRVPVVDAEGLIGLMADVPKPDRSIVGNIPDARTLRGPRVTRTLDEFLTFLAQFEALFGRDDRPRPPTTGDHFLL